MPLKRCESEGKQGWKWGDSGHCYTGPGAKKNAIRQGLAIEGPKKFKEIMNNDKNLAEDVVGEGLQYEVLEAINAKWYR